MFTNHSRILLFPRKRWLGVLTANVGVGDLPGVFTGAVGVTYCGCCVCRVVFRVSVQGCVITGGL